MKKNNTKRNLLMSVLSLLLCCSMLVGSTFAWFTDGATTGSNIIQSGKLDIVLEYWNGTEWVDAEGEVLEFEKASTSGGAEVLWEPGSTYKLPKFRVRNEGNLAAIVLLTLNGVTGDEKLLEAIKLTTTVTNIPESLLQGSAAGTYNQFNNATVDVMYGTPDGTVIFDWSLAPKGKVTPNTGHTDTTAEFTITGHMDEEAGNEYQGLTIGGFSITALATQQVFEYDSFDRNYDSEAEFGDELILENGGLITLTENRNESIQASNGAIVTVNGQGNEVIDSTKQGLLNEGIVTLNDLTMKAGTAGDYSNITRGEDAKTVYNNVEIIANGGGVAASNGAEVVFNSGSVKVGDASTSGRYNFYTSGNGSTITINGGNFSFTKTLKRAYIYANEGTTVYVNGGTFGSASTRDGYTAGILGSGTVIITGGTFGFNPSAWVAEGYEAIQSGSTWTVSAQ